VSFLSFSWRQNTSWRQWFYRTHEKDQENPRRLAGTQSFLRVSFIFQCWNCLSYVARIWVNAKVQKRTWLWPMVQKRHLDLEANTQFKNQARAGCVAHRLNTWLICGKYSIPSTEKKREPG
jgi:hypothetical protein